MLALSHFIGVQECRILHLIPAVVQSDAPDVTSGRAIPLVARGTLSTKTRRLSENHGGMQERARCDLTRKHREKLSQAASRQRRIPTLVSIIVTVSAGGITGLSDSKPQKPAIRCLNSSTARFELPCRRIWKQTGLFKSRSSHRFKRTCVAYKENSPDHPRNNRKARDKLTSFGMQKAVIFESLSSAPWILPHHLQDQSRGSSGVYRQGRAS